MLKTKHFPVLHPTCSNISTQNPCDMASRRLFTPSNRFNPSFSFYIMSYRSHVSVNLRFLWSRFSLTWLLFDNAKVKTIQFQTLPKTRIASFQTSNIVKNASNTAFIDTKIRFKVSHRDRDGILHILIYYVKNLKLLN